ncbi:MAG: hypothetical protein HZA50_11900 [Planctomycetes bacterium]|nr:hypothetical protein [Planctomycetota bacterium]
MNGDTRQVGFFGRLGGDFRSARTYLDARGKIKKLAARKQTTLGEMSASYLEIGKQAEQAGACGDLPAFGPLKDARGKLTDAQDLLAQRQQSAKSAQDALDAATKEHTGIIAELDGQYQPLAQKQAAAAGELSSARKALGDAEGRLAKSQSELSSLGAGAISGDALDARLGEANQSRGQIQANMSASQQAMHEALTGSQTAAGTLAHAQKEVHREETHLQAELSAAQALQTPDKDQKVAAAKENLESRTAENNRRIDELRQRDSQARQAYQDRTSQFESVRVQLAQADEKVRALETVVRAKQLVAQIAEIESARAQSQEKVDQAGKTHDQAKSLADAKAAELAAAKEKWNQVKSAKEGELAAANNARSQAEQAAQAAQGPLTEAQRAFGQAVFESPARPQAVETEIAKAQGLLAAIAEIDSDTTQQQIILDANRGGAKRSLIIGLSAIGILLVLIAGVIILVVCLSGGGKKDEKKTPATAPAGASVRIPQQVLENREISWQIGVHGLHTLNVGQSSRML